LIKRYFPKTELVRFGDKGDRLFVGYNSRPSGQGLEPHFGEHVFEFGTCLHYRQALSDDEIKA